MLEDRLAVLASNMEAEIREKMDVEPPQFGSGVDKVQGLIKFVRENAPWKTGKEFTDWLRLEAGFEEEELEKLGISFAA